METKMKWIIGCVLVFFLGVGMLIGSIEETPTRDIGEQLVYDRIDGMTDCNELQDEFNTAMDNFDRRQSGDSLRKVSLSYAKYTDERMSKIGCY